MTPTSTSNFSGPTGAFRIVAVIEAITYLVLLAGVVTYRVFDGPNVVKVMGPVHGIAFLVYLVLVLRIRSDQGWRFWRTIGVIVLAAVPFGGFWVEQRMVKVDPVPIRS